MTLNLLLGCLKIMFCRICDVSFGSFRTVLIVKGKTILAAVIGFFEVFIWFVVVKDALNFDGPVLPIAVSYALGYACGTYIGGSLAKLLMSSHVTIHVITKSVNDELCDLLRKAGFGITVIDVKSSPYGDAKNMILADVESKRLGEFEGIVKACDKDAFMLLQETKSYIGGYRRPGK